MSELTRLHAGHAQAVLAFELANRAFFTASVSDRGEEFFERYTDQHDALLAEQEAGTGAFYLLVAEDGNAARFVLLHQGDPTAAAGPAEKPGMEAAGAVAADVPAAGQNDKTPNN